ncbi:hypothetical protein Tco_1389699, partial [Tanacetum coccineum]
EEEATSSDSNDEEYAMAVRDFKKFFRRRGKFVRQPHDDKRNFRKAKEDIKGKDNRRCFNDSEDDSKKEEICLMALDDNKVLSDTPYYNSSYLDNESWQNDSSLQEMLEMQKPPKDKHGIGYTDDIASTSNMKQKKLGPKNSKMPSIEPALLVPSAREPASSNEQNWLSAAKMENVCLKVKLEPDEWIKDSGYSRHMTGNKDLFSSYKTIAGETMRVEESLNVKFNESPPPTTPHLEDDDVLKNKNIERQENDLEIKESEPLNKEIPNIKESKDHPLETVI